MIDDPSGAVRNKFLCLDAEAAVGDVVCDAVSEALHYHRSSKYWKELPR
jgi:hypothetical protein